MSYGNTLMTTLVPAPHTFGQIAVFSWGMLGAMVVVGEAIARLGRFSHETLKARDLGAWEIGFFVSFLAFILYTEGYRGFQKRFSPRTVARAVHLAHHPRPVYVLLAPLYCMALIGAPPRRLLASWLLIAGIVVIVLLVRLLPPLYRALVDVGVASALVWGLVSMVVYSVLALRGRPMPVPADAS